MKYTPHELKKSDAWLEKGISKHEHDFTIPCIYEQRMCVKPNRESEYQANYYEVNMCNKCHSFVVNNKHDGWAGHIGSSFSNEKDNNLPKEYNSLPRIIGIQYCKYCNIKYANILYFPDSTSWKKEK